MEEGDTEVRRVSRVLQDWFDKNELFLNTGKTNTLHFFTTRRERMEKGEAKFLGVTFDSRLTWLPHIEALESRLSSAIFAIRRVRGCIDTEVARTAYYALFHSKVLYGLTLWGNSAHIGRILLLQKRAVRAIVGAQPTDSCRPLFQGLGILTIIGEYILHTVVESFNTKQIKRSQIHHHDTRSRDQLDVPFSRLRTTDYLSQATRLRNSVPLEIRELPYNKWKRPLKAFLTNNPIYTIEEFYNI